MSAKEKKTYYNNETGPYKSDSETANNAWTLIAGGNKRPSITRKQFLERIEGVMATLNAEGQTVITPEAGQQVCELFSRLIETVNLRIDECGNEQRKLEAKHRQVLLKIEQLPIDLRHATNLGKHTAKRLEDIVIRAERVSREPIATTRNISGAPQTSFLCDICGTTLCQTKRLNREWEYEEPNFCPHCGAKVLHDETVYYEPLEEYE